jgi:prevent-host-death family protein
MKIASVADVKAHFSAYLKKSAQGAVVVTKNGKPCAVLVGVTDEEELERLVMAHSPRLQAILNGAKQRMRAGQGIPQDEFWKQVKSDSHTKVGGKRPRRTAV